jgi:hypothetical protein
MSYNGSGVFTINTAGQPVITGTTISSTTFNTLTADLATGLTTALTKDGQSTPTANIGMGGFKITNLAAGTVASDAARLDQVQGGSATFITAAGTDTITGTTSPALTAYATGNQFSFVVANTNTGAVTINVDGLGAKAITRTGTTALVAGDMVAGQAVEIIYDGTRFQLVNGNSFTNLKVSGTLGVTGVATFTAQPIVSSLTAALPVFTDASKGLVSNTMTGTGNVVMSTSPTLVTPALGTPSALVGTNITGTATNFTASNVTTNANLTGGVTSVGNAATVITNANLTGPITSVGNATSIASQTGTGTTFAMSASPTFTGTVGAAALTTTGNTILGDATTDTLNVGAGGLVKDASGNVGIGVTPSAWSSSSNALQNSGGALWQFDGSNFYVGQNYYYNGTNRIYTTTAEATEYQQGAGRHHWHTAPSGTAGNAVTMSERMRIDTSGNLLLGTTSATAMSSLVAAGQAIQLGARTFIGTSPGGDSRLGGLAGSNETVIYCNATSSAAITTAGITLVGSLAQKATGTAWTNPSDIRLKDEIQDYTKGLPELMQVQVKTWKYNGKGNTVKGEKGLGVIADEVMTVLPNTVDNYQAKLNADDEADTDIKKFDATEITWLMLNAIQELKAIVDNQADQIKALEAK